MTPLERHNRKLNHNTNMVLIAALALEHGLRFLPREDSVRKTIEEDIASVRDPEFGLASRKSRYTKARRRPVSYTTPGLLMQGSIQLLRIACSNGAVRDGEVSYVMYFPAEAGFLADAESETYGREQRAEQGWQSENIHPLLEEAFERYGELLPASVELAVLENGELNQAVNAVLAREGK